MRRIALALAVLAVLIIGATSARGYFFGRLARNVPRNERYG